MDRRTGTIITALTALLCGCPGACLLINGAMTAVNGNSNLTSGDPLTVGILFLCLGLALAMIPLVVAGFTFWPRPKPKVEVLDEDLPPAI
jgi:hypothetical protein